METTKYILILFLALTLKSYSYNIDLDSMRNENIVCSIGNFNQDCFQDTLYGKIYNRRKILPELIIWGQQDSIPCDSTFVTDTLNYEYTLFIIDSIEKDRISLIVYDIDRDRNKDFIFNYRVIDTLSTDSIYQLIIISNNNLSRKQIVYINNDSLLATTLSYISKRLYDSTNLVSRYDRYEIYLIEDELDLFPPAKIINENISEPPHFKALVFPNPNDGLLNIEVTGIPFHLKLFDIEGNLKIELNNIQQLNKSLDISKFVNGTYFLEIRTESYSNIFKIIKVK